MSAKLTGKGGKIKLGDKVVASATDWTLSKGTDYIDPRVFGSRHKSYLRPLDAVSGTFQGNLDLGGPLFSDAATMEPQHMYLYQPSDPAWWGRLKHWILGDEPPGYVFADGKAAVDVTSVGDRVSGNFRFSGPVTIHTPPMSRLERIWHRFCTRIGR